MEKYVPKKGAVGFFPDPKGFAYKAGKITKIDHDGSLKVKDLKTNEIAIIPAKFVSAKGPGTSNRWRCFEISDAETLEEYYPVCCLLSYCLFFRALA